MCPLMSMRRSSAGASREEGRLSEEGGGFALELQRLLEGLKVNVMVKVGDDELPAVVETVLETREMMKRMTVGSVHSRPSGACR